MLARHLGRPTTRSCASGLARAYELKKVREWVRARSAVSAKETGSPGPGGSISKLMWTEAMSAHERGRRSVVGAALVAADTGEWGTYAWNEHLLGAPGIPDRRRHATRSSATSSVSACSVCRANRVSTATSRSPIWLVRSRRGERSGRVTGD